jgi:hypothetical protein
VPQIPDLKDSSIFDSTALEKIQQDIFQKQQERDKVQESIFDELRLLSEIQAQQQKSIENVANSTATLVVTSEKLSPWQKWGTLLIIVLSAISAGGVIISIAVARGII